jgi:hypothetical protein
MISFLPLLTGVKQFFDMLGNSIANYLKCRSNCCYQVNVYEPKRTVIIGQISNIWKRAVTPNTKEDFPMGTSHEDSTNAFKTPRS